MATTSSVSEDEKTYGRSEVEPESQFAVFLRYPILFESAAQDSDTNGIGALSDTISCNVVRTRNQFPTLQLTYKRGGIHSKELRNGRIVMADMGPDFVHQKFRINQVQKTMDSIIVNATHIAGDIAYNTITGDIQMPNASAEDVFNSIVNKLADPMPDIRFDTDVPTITNVNMQMSAGNNAGDLLINPDQEGDDPTPSMAALFKGEWSFDDYHFYLQQRGGDDTGLVIKYGRDLKTIEQDDNIADTYTAIFPYATYTPAPPQATDSNENWVTIGSVGMANVATATYSAGGAIDIYSSPVTGHHIVGQVTNGTHVSLGKKISDGLTLPDGKVVNTVNGDDWYYVVGQGWIDARWVTFDKSGDFLVNNSVGHSTVDIGTGSGRQTKYPFVARGIVHYNGNLIHAYYSPFFGASEPGQADTTGHVRTGDVYTTGSYVDFDYKAINEKGDVWYRVANQPHRWLYGPHISFTSTGTYIEDPTARGTAAIKPNQQKYVMRKGKIVPAPAHTKYVSSRNKRTKKYVNKTYITTYHGKKIKQKHLVKNKAYSRKKKKTVKTTIKRGVYKIKGQIQYDGSTYYKTGNNVYVKSGSVDWKNRMSYKPKTIDQATKGNWINGKIEMYSQPAFKTAMNWAIPNGTSFATGATAKGDGEDWTQVTYAGQTGWVLTKYLKNKNAEDFDPYNPDDLESSDDTTPNYNVDVSDLMVKLPEVTLYADSAYGEEAPRVLAVDLSSYFSHDYQDESGFDNATGEYHVTQADIDQLRQLAQAYMREHRFGVPNVSLTLTAEQISDYQLDNIGLYDRVTVNFDQLGINETAEVNSTTWDAMAHRYTEMTIGEMPVTYEHQLLQQAKEQTTATVRGEARRTQGLFDRFENMLQLEGSDRKAAELGIMNDLGLIKQTTDEHGKKITRALVSLSDFDKQISTINDSVTNISDEILNGGTEELRFLDANGNQNFIHPTQIRATNSDGSYLDFNSQGLGFFNKGNNLIRSAITADGQVAAESITAGTINAVTIKSCLIDSALTIGKENGMNIYVGTRNPGSVLNPLHGGNVIWALSNQYQAMFSSGQIATTGNGGMTRIHPHEITIGDDMNQALTQVNFAHHAYYRIKSWVKDWVADYITINGKKRTIWKGSNKGVNMGKLRNLKDQGKTDYTYVPKSDDYGLDDSTSVDSGDVDLSDMIPSIDSVNAIKQHQEEMKQAVDNFNNFIRTGPRAPLHFEDDMGNQTMQNPTRIVAQGADHSFELNSNGLTYTDSGGQTHAAFGVDSSTGQLKGEFYVDQAYIPKLDASHIETETIHSLGTINGSLAVSNGYTQIQVGESYGGSEFGVYIGNYTSLTDGQLQVSTGNFDNINVSNYASIGSMSFSGVSIERNDGQHVMWSGSQHTNLGAFINAHIKSSAIIGGRV